MKPVAVFGFMLLLAATLFAGDKPSSQAAVIAVPNTMRQIRQAAASGDRARWDRLVAPGCVWVEPNGGFATRDYHTPKPPATTDTAVKSRSELSELHVVDHGTTAVLTYREDLQVQVGEQVSHTAMRYSEVYLWREKRWQMLLSVETPIPVREVAAVDPKAYADYVGDYQVAPNLVASVFIENGKLMLKGTGWRQAYELMPLSATRFFVRGFEKSEIWFVRDTAGRVTHQISRGPDGAETAALKIK